MMVSHLGITLQSADHAYLIYGALKICMEDMNLAIRKNSIRGTFSLLRIQTVALTLIITAFTCLAMFAIALDDLGRRQVLSVQRTRKSN